MTGILLSVSQVHIRESASTEVTGQLNFITQTIGRLVRTASNIEITAGVSTSTLKLRMQDSTKDPTCISLVSGTIKLAEGPGTNPNDCSATTSDLTNSRVVVNALNFKKFVQYPGHDTVSYDVQMTYNSQNPKAQVQRSLSSAIARVSAATFDSSLLPGNTTYEIGQSGSAWSKAYLGDGTTGGPSYTFGNDTTLGIFKVAGTSTIGFSTQGLERMRISASGNVGIGTTGPNTKLEVSDPTAIATTTPLLRLSTGIPSLGYGPAIDYYYGGATFGRIEVPYMYNASADMVFSTYSSAISPTGLHELMRIKGSGNVGIGTTTPNQKLSVVGTIESTSGGFKFPDNTTQTTAAGGVSPSFSVHKNGTNQTVVTTTFTKITWSTEEWDINNNFAGDKFTPTVAGKYMLSAGAEWLTNPDNHVISIYKNGSQYKNTGMNIASVSTASNWVSAVVDANGTTDYFEVYIYQASGSDKTLNGLSTYTYFQGHKLP